MPTALYFKRLFNLYAPLYPLVSRVFSKSRATQIDNINQFFSTDKAETKKVLLVGGGDGLDIQFFTQTMDITYLDNAKGMFDKAQRSFKNRENTHFILADFNEYAINDKSQFDVICLHFCLASTYNPSLMMSGARKLLKSGGLLSVMDVAKSKQYFFSKTLNFVTKHTMFNIFNDIERDISVLNDLTLVYKKPLIESKSFNAYLYEKK